MTTRHFRATNETRNCKRNSTKLFSYLTLFALSGLAVIASAAFSFINPTATATVHLAPAPSSSQISQDRLWTRRSEEQVTRSSVDSSTLPTAYAAYRLDESSLRSLLAAAPEEYSRGKEATLSLPMPDGSFSRFRIEHSLVVEPGLLKKYPELGATYSGYGIDDPTASVRFDLLPSGFHAYIRSSSGTIMINPSSNGEPERYLSFHKNDSPRLGEFVCEFGREAQEELTPVNGVNRKKASNAPGASFVVTNTNNNGAGSLRQAVLDANSAAGADTITFDPTVFSTPQIITLASVITINGVNDTLTITGPGANLLTVSGNNAVAIFSISAGEITTITGMTITQAVGGAIANSGNLTVTNSAFIANTDTNGGAITNSSSAVSLTVDGCTFTDNRNTALGSSATGGAAIFSDAPATITNSTFTNNMTTGGAGGGAIDTRGVMSITGSTFTGNATTFDGGLSKGGAISVFGDGQLTINNTVITGNSSVRDGGGLYYQPNVAGALLTITNSTISNNTSNSDSNTTGNGGGLFLTGTGSVTISGSTINGNTANTGSTTTGRGGGIDVSVPTTITNSTISGNTAARDGGGIYATGTSTVIISIEHSTIANNTAAFDCGGLYRASATNPVSFGNTLIANNTDDGTAPDLLGTVDSDGFNLVENITGSTITGDTATNITGQDPNLGLLLDNGGLTFTHALQPGSPAIDKGASGSLTTDQRSQTRPVDDPAIPNASGGDGADIGAFEVQPSLQFSSATYSVSETGITVTITVNRSGGSEGADSVQYATSDITATGGATCGVVDYQTAAGTLNFAAGVLSQTFDVTICDDTFYDGGDETINLALSLPIGATIGSPNTSVLTILENEPPPNTPVGTNVNVPAPSGDASATFPTVTQAGYTTFTPIVPPSSAGVPPPDYTILGSGPAYDITTTAIYTPPVIVCFTVSSITDPAEFARARILHGEGGLLVDRTILAPDSPAPDFPTRRVCARVDFLSPFVAALIDAPTASDGTVTGRIVADDGTPVEGAVVRLAGTQNRKFITDANGFYSFDNVETNGFYTVTPLRANYTFNPSSRSFSQLGETTEAAFSASLTSNGFVNPLDTPEYFVRQHYLDFLGREPDESGFNFWSDQILECDTDTNCIERRRENVSAAYFLSIEFQQTGGLVDGLYRASYGVRPNFGEFMPDARAVGLGVVVGAEGWQARLQANKEAFVNAFAQQPAFRAAYDGLSGSEYVDTLISHTGVTFTAAERDALANDLANGTQTRADVLRSIAENSRFVSAKFNETFVMMEYFGYLRRDPDESGYTFWLNKLSEFNGNFERAEMVKAFIVSGEFRNRFPR